jgi:tetratricopeptide (TPR) repeat protein
MRALLLFVLTASCAAALASAAAQTPLAAQRRAQVSHEKILQEHPTSAPAHLAYAEFLSENGNLRAAIAHWHEAQRLDPGNAATANSLGGAYLRMGRAAESAAQFSRAIELASGNAAYHFNLANVEFMLRHDLQAAWKVTLTEVLRRALVEFRTASDLSPYDVEYARAYAETFYGMPDPDWAQAALAWKRVLALSPRGDFAYLQLARVSLKRGDANEARRCLAKLSDSRNESLKRKLLAEADLL